MKAIILTAGLGTRFLPLSKVVPKELWPLAGKPLIHYIVEEIVNSGISQIIFVVNPQKNIVLDYFKPSLALEKILAKKNKEDIIKELKSFNETFEKVSFSSVKETMPLGDGHAILQAKRLVGKEPVAVMFSDDIVESKDPCLSQLIKVFKACQKPVVALYRVPREKVCSYGTVGVEKIANRVFKIRKIVEKPSLEEAPSDLVIVGKYIITPEVFKYLRETPPNDKGEVILAEALMKMINDGKIVYGYEFEGKWLECGNKSDFLESNFYLSLKNPEFGPKLKKYLKQ